MTSTQRKPHCFSFPILRLIIRSMMDKEGPRHSICTIPLSLDSTCHHVDATIRLFLASSMVSLLMYLVTLASIILQFLSTSLPVDAQQSVQDIYYSIGLIPVCLKTTGSVFLSLLLPMWPLLFLSESGCSPISHTIRNMR